MAFIVNDRVKETTTTTGTGTITLAGAVTGFETFAAGIGNSNTTYYCIALQDGSEFEVGLGTLSSDSSTIARTTVISSSNSDNAVDFSSGTKDVFCTLPASKAVIEDASNNVAIGNDLTIGAKLKLPTNTANKILVADGTSFEEVDMSGDATIASGGALTIANDAVTFAKMQDTTTANRVLGAVSAGTIGEVQVATDMIADDAVTAAKLADTSVSAGSYTATSLTVDAQGRITAASSGSAGVSAGFVIAMSVAL